MDVPDQQYAYPPFFESELMQTPGALISGLISSLPSTVIGPLLLNHAILSELSTAPTADNIFFTCGKNDSSCAWSAIPRAAITVTRR